MGRNKSIQGFTLMEVLIALTLLSIMVVLLFTSLKICADSWEKGESKIEQVNEIGIVYNFFQRHLSAALPLWNDLNTEKSSLAFEGTQQSLKFISTFPASAGKSGLQLISINLQEEDQEKLIKVTLTPFFPNVEGEQWNQEEVTLIRHVTAFNLTYFGSEDGISEGSWQDEWLEKQVQPKLVKISIELENDIFWPDMIFELKVVGTNRSLDEDTLARQQIQQ